MGETGASGWIYYEDNNTYDEEGFILELGDNAYLDAVTEERFTDSFGAEGTSYYDVFSDLLMYD